MKLINIKIEVMDLIRLLSSVTAFVIQRLFYLVMFSIKEMLMIKNHYKN